MRFFLAALVLAAGLGPARAAEPTTRTVGALFNWYYATSFGTGVYTSGTTTVTAVNMPFRYTMREATDTDWGWGLQLPVTAVLGDFRLDDVGGMDLAAVSFMPGAELVMPLQPNWRLSGFANVGGAWEVETNSTAAIYRAGLSTRYRVASLRDPDLEFGFKVIHAGYGAAGEYGNPVNLATLGVTSSVPLPWSVSEDQQTRLGVRWGVTHYFTAVRFRLPSIGYTEITSEWEAGLALVFRPGVRFLGTSWERLGLNYVQASNGLHGVRLETEFPF